jgi:hypothetical protein
MRRSIRERAKGSAREATSPSPFHLSTAAECVSMPAEERVPFAFQQK